MAFHYNAVTRTNGRVTTRVSKQGNVTTAQIVAAAAAETPGLTPEQITAAGTSILRQVILLGARESKDVLRLFGLMSFRPTSGGDFPDLDFQPTPAALNLALSGSVAPDGQTLYESGLDFVRDENIGVKHAIIERVYNATTNSTDRYTSGGGFKISGQDLGNPDLTNVTYGVFLQSISMPTLVRCPSIIDWTNNEISGAWASGVTGPQRLIIVTRYDGGTARTTTYGTNLT